MLVSLNKRCGTGGCLHCRTYNLIPDPSHIIEHGRHLFCVKFLDSLTCKVETVPGLNKDKKPGQGLLFDIPEPTTWIKNVFWKFLTFLVFILDIPNRRPFLLIANSHLHQP